MNRRAFLLAIPFLPAVARAITQSPVRVGPEYFWQVNSGIHGMLEQCGNVVEKRAPDLEYVFQKVYALKCHRERLS